MRLRARLAVLVCKASGAVLRKLGRGGTNLPGKLALKIDKNILGELSRGVRRHGRDPHERQDHHLPHDRAGACGRRTQAISANKSGANLLTGVIGRVRPVTATLTGRCP